MRRLLLAALLLTGCANFSNLSFRIDHRLHWLTPGDRQLVSTPFTLSWSMAGFVVTGPATGPPDRRSGYFAIFVDRAPVRPGQTLAAVATGDRSCHLPACPDTAYLADRGVYPTATTSFTVSLVPPISGVRDRVQLHQVTVVLLDASGRRIGESAWIREFKMRRTSS